MGITAAVCCTLLGAVLLYGLTVGRSRIRVERVEVASSRLPAGFDGFRVAMFSDVHTGLLLGRDRVLRRMVDIINALDADVVVNCGDIVNYDYRELAVLGYHVLRLYIRDTVAYPPQENVLHIVEAQRSLGWTVLSDSSAILVRGGDSIALTGLSFPEELVHR